MILLLLKCYEGVLIIEGKVSKSDLERIYTIDTLGDLNSRIYSGNQNSCISMIPNTFFLYIQDLYFRGKITQLAYTGSYTQSCLEEKRML